MYVQRYVNVKHAVRSYVFMCAKCVDVTYTLSLKFEKDML